MKISFDFDDTLETEQMQKLAKKFIKEGHKVYITTGRLYHPYWNNDVFKLAQELNIPAEQIQLTEGADKHFFLKGFDMHFDNNPNEIYLINKNIPECCGVGVYTGAELEILI